MMKTYCQRINTNEYRKDAQKNTNDAIMMLYTQILEMEDGTKKNEFLAKVSQLIRRRQRRGVITALLHQLLSSSIFTLL